VIVEIPAKLTSEMKELLKEFDAQSKDSTHPRHAKFFDKVKHLFE